MSNKAELLKKIKALADRGVDGERESAQNPLCHGVLWRAPDGRQCIAVLQ